MQFVILWVCNKALFSLPFFLSDSLAVNWLPASRPVRGSWISLLLKVLFCFSAGLTDCPWLPGVASLCFVVALAADSPGRLLTLSQPDSLAQRVLWRCPLWRHTLHLQVLCRSPWSSYTLTSRPSCCTRPVVSVVLCCVRTQFFSCPSCGYDETIWTIFWNVLLLIFHGRKIQI